jgi:hypothetical protein
MLKKIMGTVLLVAALGRSTAVFAGADGGIFDSVEMLATDKVLERGASVELRMDLVRDVAYLELDAHGIGADAMFEVIVNGQIKGTVYVPGQDPKYVVTIADETRSFTLRHLSGARVRVTSFKAYFEEQDQGRVALPGTQIVAADISLQIISKMDKFQSKISVDDYRDYILPVKMAAGHSYAIATASGDLSRRLDSALNLVQQQFRVAKPFFDRCLGRGDLFEQTVEALELMYRLEELRN